MRELKTAISEGRKESDTGHEAVINAILSEIAHRYPRKSNREETK
jgi:hypothetical protein